MDKAIQEEARRALEDFLQNPGDLDALERRIAALWVDNGRTLDGVLGEIYDIVTDWDHKFSRDEAIRLLGSIHG